MLNYLCLQLQNISSIPRHLLLLEDVFAHVPMAVNATSLRKEVTVDALFMYESILDCGHSIPPSSATLPLLKDLSLIVQILKKRITQVKGVDMRYCMTTRTY